MYVEQLRWTHWALWEDISACFSSFEFLLIRYNKFRKIDCHDQLVLLLLFIVSALKYQLRQGYQMSQCVHVRGGERAGNSPFSSLNEPNGLCIWKS